MEVWFCIGGAQVLFAEKAGVPAGVGHGGKGWRVCHRAPLVPELNGHVFEGPAIGAACPAGRAFDEAVIGESAGDDGCRGAVGAGF